MKTEEANRIIVDRRKTHGMSKTKTYSSWVCMKSRCLNKNDSSYHRYGEVGIKVIKGWLKFENFLEDMGERPDGMTIDRIDNNLGYSKENCKWSTVSEQNFNKKAKMKGVSYSKARNKWRSYICLGNREIKWLGEYDTEQAAAVSTAKEIQELTKKERE